MTNKRKKELEFDKYGLPMPPKTLARAMVEAAEGKRKLPKNVITAAKKIVSRVPPKPPGKMPTSIRMNKVNRGKIQESLGKSVRIGSDKPKKLDSGGLIGNQKKLDMDNSGSLTKKDFQMLRNKPTVNKKLGGSIQVSGNNFSGVY
tara:strand:- start:26 stop:463 length:438 start_codon:yes stop_codon:yes gene_type:complete